MGEKGIIIMSIILRILLLAASVVTSMWILWKIRKNSVKQEDALFWICFAIMLELLGVFPKLSYIMSAYLGVQSPANFVFMVIIAALLEKIFTLSIQQSFLESKMEIMAAELAIRCKSIEDNIDNINRNNMDNVYDEEEKTKIF